jgi:drug/metabolite transporter (DMT)-like permease
LTEAPSPARIRALGNNDLVMLFLYSNLTPVVAVSVSWLALGDALRLLQVAGALAVLTGLVLTRRGRSSQRLRGAVREPRAADDIELRRNT